MTVPRWARRFEGGLVMRVKLERTKAERLAAAAADRPAPEEELPAADQPDELLEDDRLGG